MFMFIHTIVANPKKKNLVTCYLRQQSASVRVCFRHFAASKMAEFCVSCGSKVNPGDKFSFKCGSKGAEISHPSARISTPEDERASSSSSTKSLSQYLASKAEERRGYKLNKPNNKAGFKRKVSDPGSSSKRNCTDFPADVSLLFHTADRILHCSQSLCHIYGGTSYFVL